MIRTHAALILALALDLAADASAEAAPTPGKKLLVTGIAKEHGGAYGLGILYAKEMLGAQEGAH